MGSLSASQLSAIRDFLASQGVVYPALQDEMVDHICCDIERHMEQGYSYEVSWQKVLLEIPPKQLHTLQLNTMETISKRPSLPMLFAYLSFFLLVAGSVFKLLHFPGAGELIIGAFAAVAVSLIAGSIAGMYTHKDKRGAWLLITVVLSVILFLNSLVFQILHLPGATEIRTIAVLALSVLFPLSFFYVRINSEQILPYLHDKFAPAITRFVVILFCVGCATRITLIATTGSSDVLSRIVLVIVIAASGLHFFALSWKAIQVRTSPWTLTILTIAFLCFMLPALVRVLSPAVRTVLVTGYFILAGAYILSIGDKVNSNLIKSLSVSFVIAVQLAWAFASQGIIPFASFHALAFIVLFVLLILNRKDVMMSTFMISFIAHYLFVYPSTIPY